jgi:hypothetical protein
MSRRNVDITLRFKKGDGRFKKGDGVASIYVKQIKTLRDQYNQYTMSLHVNKQH